MTGRDKLAREWQTAIDEAAVAVSSAIHTAVSSAPIDPALLNRRMREDIDDPSLLEVASALDALDEYGLLTEARIGKLTGPDLSAAQCVSLEKALEKSLTRRLDGLQGRINEYFRTLDEAGYPESLDISVKYIRNSYWGNWSPRATLSSRNEDNWERIDSDSISGAGYDKVGTAVGQAMWRSDSLQRALVDIHYGAEEKPPYGMRFPVPADAVGFYAARPEYRYFGANIDGSCGKSSMVQILESVFGSGHVHETFDRSGDLDHISAYGRSQKLEALLEAEASERSRGDD